MKPEKKAQILYEAIERIAAHNEYPPAPAYYLDIQRQWRRMVTTARKAKAKIDADA